MGNNPSTEELLEWDRQYIWHPFTPMKAWMAKQDVPVITHGQDEFLFDTEGRRYIDGVSSLWCNIHGHRVPEIDEAVKKQLEQIAHSTLLGLCNVPSIILAKRLVQIMPPGLTRVFYSDDGSTAVEAACKLACQFWANQGKPQRSRFICFDEAYHGDTVGAVSLGGIPMFHEAYRRLCFPVDRVKPPLLPAFAPLDAAVTPPAPAAVRDLNWIASIEKLLVENPDQYAGIFIEPVVQGAGGMLMHPPGTLRALRELADRHDLLLIFDEVMTGFGRTGRMFACEHEKVSPDLLCLSKGLTAGYMPLGATLVNDRVFNAFYADPREGKTFYHGHTFTGHPLACAAAIASLDLFDSRRLLEHVAALKTILAAELAPLRRHPNVGDVRQVGLIAAVDIVQDRTTGEKFDYQRRVGGALCTMMRSRGVFLRPLGDVLVVMPPLATRPDNIRILAQAVVKSLEDDLPVVLRN
ncbi:MAG TPA: adenosylmethionine--8-amino-7-oxononanoate transaminase [Phycisphaerae bacterium]|nr:adenosylmethionine--8-amino-7-oxononanoate transaminase [Phycisphaerae bacterium]